ncbi:MAG: SIMPL domain-containing protein [Candidatus Eremiobacteraeota bacterium]|nr:SIMPL domain-containing protein [Candidatus Eremiobacteraeota bacterium]MBC5828047.1 SIMPL domain-containing protein [Candidatus Eremiobacteraeota bacterium]
MNKLTLIALASCLSCASGGSLAAADTVAIQPPSISVTATGSVSYVPNIARLSLGVRVESSSAGSAAAAVNARAQAVVNALRNGGIAARDMKTSGYTLEYQQPPSPQAQPLMQPGSDGAVQSSAATQAQSRPVMSTAPTRGFPNEHRLVLAGSYVATETIDVKAPVSRAGAAIDTGINAGANQTYGLSYDTSARDALYRDALTAAVRAARSQAADIARAAGVSIASLQSVSTSQGGFNPEPQVFMARASTAPPVLAGTDTITATVQVTYRVH